MPYSKQDAFRQFENWSAGYDSSVLQKLLFGPSHSRIAAELPVAEPVQLLDVGCGTGRFMELVLVEGRAAKVWGLDISKSMLTHGKQRLRRYNGSAHIVQGDAERLPFPSDYFDVVTCSNCFHHFPDQQQAVCEMFRVLRDGGRVMLIDGYRDNLWGRFIYDFCVVRVEGPVHHASARRFQELMTTAGFTDVWQEVTLGLAPFILTVGTARKRCADDLDRQRVLSTQPLSTPEAVRRAA